MEQQEQRFFSFGGGVQSTACLVLAAQGKIDYRLFLFANTGEDSENPETLEYIKNVSMPFADKHGLDLWMCQHPRETLYQSLVGENRTIAIPVYMPSGAPGTRKCTSEWKIEVVSREVRRRRGMGWKNPAIVGLGISTDEADRAKSSRKRYIVHEHPLLLLGISRMECANIIREAGLPVPPKSSCWFCPYKKLTEWRKLAKENPVLFENAAKLEAKRSALSEQRNEKIFLTRTLKPLREAVLPDEQLSLFDMDCTGYCWT